MRNSFIIHVNRFGNVISKLLLSSESARVRWLIMKLGQRYPKFRTALVASKDKARQWRQRIQLGRRSGSSGPTQR